MYSTCTFAPKDNEGIMHYLTKKHPNALLEKLYCLLARMEFVMENQYPEGFKTQNLPNEWYSGG